MRNIKIGVIAFLVFIIPALAFADIAVIVSQSSPLEKISSADLKAVYLGQKSFVGDVNLKPAHLQTDDGIYNKFIKQVLRFTVRMYKVTWMKNIFSEGISAPEEKDSVAALVSFIKGKEGAIGYMNAEDAKAASGIKIIATYASD